MNDELRTKNFMIIKTIVVGELETNCYIVASNSTREAMIIDPGDDAEKIIKAVDDDMLKPVLIVNTHAHPDHVRANNELVKKYKIEAAAGRKDYELIKRWGTYFEFFAALNIQNLGIKRLLDGGDIIKIGELEFKVLATPGHSEGSICLYGEGALFSGDTLFLGDCGRTDIPGGSEDDIKRSISSLLELPGDTKVYPGHGGPTTIKKERTLYAKS